MATKINIRTLLEAGCHFGHQTRRWNPKMKPFIFGERNNIYILDLKQTIVEADKAYTFLKETAAKGGKVLFVGTKKQAQEAVKSAAERANMPYINQRWLGGMLTNFVTIRSRMNRLEELEGMVADGSMALRGKKEQAVLGKELASCRPTLVAPVSSRAPLPRSSSSTPSARRTPIKEAKRLGIPVVALIDTNSDPDEVEYGIPCNDDAISAIQLMSELFADACLAGSGKDADLRGRDGRRGSCYRGCRRVAPTSSHSSIPFERNEHGSDHRRYGQAAPRDDRLPDDGVQEGSRRG